MQPLSSTPALVPVTITQEPEAAPVTPLALPAETALDTIEFVISGDCRVRVGLGFDARALKRVLDLLRRR